MSCCTKCRTIIDPTAPPPTDDTTFTANAGQLTGDNAWQPFYFPLDVLFQPTSYPGASQNGFQTIDVAYGKNPTGAGQDPVWITFPAGRTIYLPCGRYWIRAGSALPNGVNYRYWPAPLSLVDESYEQMVPLPPTFVTVGAASAQALPARVGRRGLSLVNTSSQTISFGLNGAAAVLNSGITLLPGQPVVLIGRDCPQGIVNAIAGAGNSNLAVQEW